MSASHIATFGNFQQIEAAVTGEVLRGHREPRIAFLGRSNVGKSSLINRLLGAKLAQVSKEPGKTRLVHCYRSPELGRVLVDLPGYGYARQSQTDRAAWGKLIDAYLKTDLGLTDLMVLLDSRHGPTDVDREAIEFLSLKKVPISFVFTKFDALKNQKERAKRLKEVEAELNAGGYRPKWVIWCSSESGQGIAELRRVLREG